MLKYNKGMSLEDWSDINSEQLDILFAETGQDREMCFDREVEQEKIFKNN